jgi:hypothetical protein
MAAIIQIGTKLKRGPRLVKVIQKHTSQSFAIDCIPTSTWGASFRMANLVYTSVIRPAKRPWAKKVLPNAVIVRKESQGSLLLVECI